MARAAVGLPRLAILQAELRARDGGLSLAGARMMWAAVHLARGSAVLPYIRDHGVAYCLDSQALDYSLSTPYFDGLRRALDALHEQSVAAAASHPDLASLLSGSPRSQHDLAEGASRRRCHLSD